MLLAEAVFIASRFFAAAIKRIRVHVFVRFDHVLAKLAHIYKSFACTGIHAHIHIYSLVL